MVARARVRERDIKTPMEEVQTLPQLHRAGADQPVRNCFLLYIYFILFILVSNFASIKFAKGWMPCLFLLL